MNITIDDIEIREKHRRFTNRETELGLFEKLVFLTDPPHRVLGFYGSPGVGKSALLDEFKYSCKRHGIPYISLDGYAQKNVLGILNRIRQQAGKKILPHKFDNYDRLALNYVQMQNSLSSDEELILGFRREIDEISVPDKRSVILNDITALSSLNTLKEMYQPKDIEFFLSAEDHLTDALIQSLESSDENNWVILIDAYENLESLDDWIRSNFVKALPSNFRIILAGRANYAYEWRQMATFTKFKLVTFRQKDVVKYLAKREIDAEEFANEVFTITAGHPLFVAMSADARKENPGVSFTQSSEDKFLLLGSIVDYVRSNIKDKTLKDSLKVCSVVRFFNKSSIEYVLEARISDEKYASFLKYAWVKKRSYGHSLHDSVREYILEECKNESRELFVRFSERAIDYYGQTIALNLEGEWSPYAIEVLYHKSTISPQFGLDFLIRVYNMAETQYRLDFCEALLREAKSYDIGIYGDWLNMFEARLANYRDNWEISRDLYEKLFKNKAIDIDLAAYALAGLGRVEYRLGNIKYAQELFEQALAAHNDAGRTTQEALLLHNLGRIKIAQRDWKLAKKYLGQALEKIDHELTREGDITLFSNTFLDAGPMFEREKGAIYNSLGTVNFEQGRWDDAIAAYSNSLDIFRSLSETQGIARALYRIGWVLEKKGKWSDAMDFYMQSRELFIKRGADYWIARTIVKIGDLYRYQGKYEKSYSVYEECMDICLDLQANLGISVVTDRFGNIAQENGELLEAEKFHLKSLQLKEDQAFPFEIEETLLNLGDLYSKMGKYELSMKYYLRSLSEMKKMNYKHGEATLLTKMARISIDSGIIDIKSQEWLKRAYNLSKYYKYYGIQGDAELLMGVFYLLNDDFSSAEKHFKRSMGVSRKFNKYKEMEILRILSDIKSDYPSLGILP